MIFCLAASTLLSDGRREQVLVVVVQCVADALVVQAVDMDTADRLIVHTVSHDLIDRVVDALDHARENETRLDPVLI